MRPRQLQHGLERPGVLVCVRPIGWKDTTSPGISVAADFAPRTINIPGTTTMGSNASALSTYKS
jgi:hypothetical protein